MKKRTLLVSGILLLLLAGLKWARHLSQYMDVTFGDEAQYLRYGLDLFQTIKKDWGPSYNLWYKFLSFFQSNPVSLFYLNYQVTTIVLAILLFLFLVRYNISVIISYWLSFCFLLSTTVIDTWPPSGFSSRPAACSREDLPEPDGPISPTISPGMTSRSTPLSTGRWPASVM